MEVKDFITDSQWNVPKLLEKVSKEMVRHIVDNISPALTNEDNDVPWWMGSNLGNFSVKTTWEEIRRKEGRSQDYRNIWIKGIPIKICFFNWRANIRRIPTNDNL